MSAFAWGMLAGAGAMAAGVVVGYLVWRWRDDRSWRER